jgi:LAO/AO transport system kinase
VRRMPDSAELAADVVAGGRRALARAISIVENAGVGPDAENLLAALFPHTGHAILIGVTGAPGTGKSTLVNQIALSLRRSDRSVGIVAVDPTSPFSGGAILGDRIRMRDLSGDPGIFIRSMATRGSLGGLARATSDAVLVLDAAGFDVVLIETVGAGQAEVDIARLAQTVLVVDAPGLGDDVQAVKAGILEIADVIVVNKADDPRADETARMLEAMLKLGQPAPSADMRHHGRLMGLETVQPAEPAGARPHWDVPIHLTNALTGEGVAELVAQMASHHDYLTKTGELVRRARARALADLDARLREVLIARLLEHIDRAEIHVLVDAIVARELMPRQAAMRLLEAQPTLD